MTKSKIEWTDRTWNVITGCTKVSAGCKNCYAETMAKRFWAKQYLPNSDGTLRKFTDIRLHYGRLALPEKWGKTCKVFVNSMSDLFHEDVPFGFIDEVFNTMAVCNHTFQVLTKRPKRMLEYMLHIQKEHYTGWIEELFSNVWMGVSVEDQVTADERIPLLLQTPAAVRFVSCEPLLERIKLFGFASPTLGPLPASVFLHWVIVGGESGPHARPMHPDWVRSIRDQCQAAGVPFFFKQMSKKSPTPDDLMIREFPP